MKNQTLIKHILITGSFLYCLAAAPAADLFQIQMTTTTPGGPPALTISDDSALDLVESAIQAQDQFAAFNGLQRNATLMYAGVPNAIQVSVNATETQARLVIPSTGFTRTFTGVDSNDLENQVEDFLKEEGSAELAKFYKQVNAQSLVAVTDGNPHSSTALMANRAFDQFGMYLGQTREELQQFKEYTGRVSLGVAPQVGLIDAGPFSGTAVSLPIDLRIQVLKRLAVVLDLTPSYTEIEGSDIFHLLGSVGLPIKLIDRSPDSPWYWQVTPSGGAIASGSADFVAGGLIGEGTFSSLLAYQFPHFTLAMGNQISFFESSSVSISDYEFDPGVSQQLLKNGLQVSVPLGGRWVGQLFGTHSWFLRRAAIDDYYTVGGNLAYRWLGKADAPEAGRGYVFAGLYADLAEDYTAPYVRIGTGWKF